MIKTNKKIWDIYNDDEMVSFKKSVFDYYRINGFPYFKTDMDYRDNEYNKIFKYDYLNVIDTENKVIKQTMHSLALAWSYMPHSWDVVCNDKMTPIEAFNSDEIFKRVIEKRVRFGDNVSDNGIRKMLKMFTGVQSVSNFRPTAASAIYSLFCDKGDLVWDMSSGYGGRLLGADRVGVKYIGTDPASKTVEGLNSMIRDYAIDADIFQIGSEDFVPDKDSLDFCFTSPPYFDTEKYSDEETQSYIGYNTHDKWINGFLKKTFENCYHGLKSGKYMAINIANVKSFKTLESETIRVAEEVGFVHTDTWKYTLSAMKSGFKYEPIFIFKKV